MSSNDEHSEEPGKWLEPPQVSQNDPQAKVKEIQYQAQMDVVKAFHLGRMEVDKARDLLQIEREKAEIELDKERQKGQVAAEQQVYVGAITFEQEMEKAVQAVYLEVAQGQVDRIQTRATFIQSAAAAITTLYTAVLTVTFAADKATLPARGLAPTIFLGLAIAFAAVYYAYVTQPKDLPHAQPTGNPAQKRQRRLDRFIMWSRAPALQRRYFMQVAAVCLGVGVFFLPAAFLKIADWLVFLLVALALAGCLLAPGALWLAEKLLDRKEPKPGPEGPAPAEK